MVLSAMFAHMSDWLACTPSPVISPYWQARSNSNADYKMKSLARISRAPDGRFIVVAASNASGSSHSCSSSSSDDGGFLARRHAPKQASWRRPLVAYPSQLSVTTPTMLLHHLPTIYSPISPPPRAFRASSPAPGTLLTTAWSPSYNFSDLSSVRQPSSVEKSFPTISTTPNYNGDSGGSFTAPGYAQLRTVHERYSQELPSLRAIHEETWRNKVALPLFLPVHPLATSSPPRVRITTPRARLPPRHARHARSAPELAHDLMETSPSSSSGFGSKNTSQQNQSSQSGSLSVEWRLPPYRPPPQPFYRQREQPLTPLVNQWLEFTNTVPAVLDPAGLDASVDGHYEFDSITPIMTTPTGITGRGDELRGTSDSEIYSASFFPSHKQTKRIGTKYDNIEARVQAMKEEFNEFRKRQAKRRRSDELESAC